jgi:hypothetical protein
MWLEAQSLTLGATTQILRVKVQGRRRTSLTSPRPTRSPPGLGDGASLVQQLCWRRRRDSSSVPSWTALARRASSRPFAYFATPPAMNRRKIIPLLIAALGFAQTIAAPQQEGLITFSPGRGQTEAELRAAWAKIPEDTRKQIESHLVSGLGLSSTGTINLLGSFNNAPTGNTKNFRVFQFQQVDLFGSRLFWTALIDPDALTSRVIYHVDESKIQTKWVAFGDTQKP